MTARAAALLLAVTACGPDARPIATPVPAPSPPPAASDRHAQVEAEAWEVPWIAVRDCYLGPHRAAVDAADAFAANRILAIHNVKGCWDETAALHQIHATTSGDPILAAAGHRLDVAAARLYDDEHQDYPSGEHRGADLVAIEDARAALRRAVGLPVEPVTAPTLPALAVEPPIDPTTFTGLHVTAVTRDRDAVDLALDGDRVHYQVVIAGPHAITVLPAPDDDAPVRAVPDGSWGALGGWNDGDVVPPMVGAIAPDGTLRDPRALPARSLGIPVAAIGAAKLRLVVLVHDDNLVAVRSKNAGATWSAPVRIGRLAPDANDDDVHVATRWAAGRIDLTWPQPDGDVGWIELDAAHPTATIVATATHAADAIATGCFADDVVWFAQKDGDLGRYRAGGSREALASIDAWYDDLACTADTLLERDGGEVLRCDEHGCHSIGDTGLQTSGPGVMTDAGPVLFDQTLQVLGIGRIGAPPSLVRVPDGLTLVTAFTGRDGTWLVFDGPHGPQLAALP